MKRTEKKDRLVQIFVPDQDGSEQGTVGTGFPVAAGRVLTAKHVLSRDGQRIAHAFKARWYYLCDRDAADLGYQTVEPSAVAWPDDDGLDAVVFELPLPPDLRQNRVLSLSKRRLLGDEKWSTAGFADFGCIDAKGDGAVSAGGTVLLRATQEPLNLQVDGSYEEPEGWRGASGGPVIVDNRAVGLLTDLPPGFAGTRLQAVPAAWLLDDSGLRESLGQSSWDELRTATMRQALGKSGAAVLALSRELPGMDAAGYGSVSDALVDKLVEVLLDSDASDLLDAGIAAIIALHEAKPDPQASKGARSAVVELVLSLLPLLHDPAVVAAARSDDETNAVLLGCDISSYAVAEALMAALDEKPCWYQPFVREKATDGVMRLAGVPHNRGFDADHRKLREDWTKQLQAKFGSDPEGAFKDRFYDCAREVVRDTVTDDTLDRQSQQSVREQRIAADLAKTLKNDWEQKKRRYYYVFTLPTDPAQAGACRAVIEQLKATYEAIAFVELSLDPALHDRQFDSFRSLIDILK